MKTFFALTIIAAGICIGSAAVRNDYVAKVKAVGEKCKEVHKVDDDTYQALLKMHKIPTSEEGKCMIACYMKEMGYVHDGKYDLDAMKESNSHKWDEAAIIEKANNVAKECVEEASSDENDCDTAAKLLSCFIEKAGKEGIPSLELD